MIRVLHIGKFYPPHRGGMETHLKLLANELSKSVDVRVLVSAESLCSTEEWIDGVYVHRAGRWLTIAATSFCPGMVKVIHKSEADLVHLHWPNPAGVLAWLAARHQAPLVLTYHSDVIRQRLLSRCFSPILEMIINKSAAVIATSPNYIESSPVLSRWRHKCVVIPLAISDEHHTPVQKHAAEAMRCRLGRPLVLTVGRYVYYKGFKYLIEAMTSVPAHLLIAGDGPLRPQFESLVSRLGLTPRVHLVSGLSDDDIRACYHACDVFVLPSITRAEAFGLVQLEAMAAKKAVVNTAINSGVSFVSRHRESGITVPPANSDALAKAINTLLADQDLRIRYGSAGHERAAAEFSVPMMTRRTLDVYSRVCGIPLVSSAFAARSSK